jgi:NAD(P)-dependent dehydrogenase (short-subunit alcohol dehydrogenase family)
LRRKTIIAATALQPPLCSHRSNDARADVVRVSASGIAEDGERTFGRVDVMISNAGLMPQALLELLKVVEWEQMINVNIKGVLYGFAAGAAARAKSLSEEVPKAIRSIILPALPSATAAEAHRALFVVAPVTEESCPPRRFDVASWGDRTAPCWRFHRRRERRRFTKVSVKRRGVTCVTCPAQGRV